MTSPISLIYGYDPLCGWCCGFIPALRYFTKCHPDVEVDVLPGGLMTGDRVRSYSYMADYISKAVVNLKQVTGRHQAMHFLQ
jgi:putative protein-disulfide isomerase